MAPGMRSFISVRSQDRLLASSISRQHNSCAGKKRVGLASAVKLVQEMEAGYAARRLDWKRPSVDRLPGCGRSVACNFGS